MKYYYIHRDTKKYHILTFSSEYLVEIKKTYYVLIFFEKQNCFQWTLNYDIKLMPEYPFVFESRGTKEKILYLKESELFNPDVEKMIANTDIKFIPVLTEIRRTINLKNIINNL